MRETTRNENEEVLFAAFSCGFVDVLTAPPGQALPRCRHFQLITINLYLLMFDNGIAFLINVLSVIHRVARSFHFFLAVSLPIK